jgi:hypothetical protein
MDRIVAFLDDKDTKQFLGLDYPITFCTYEQFKSQLAYRNDEINLDNFIIFSSRLIPPYYKQLKRLIKAHNNLTFRVFDLEDNEEIHDQFFTFNWDMVNVVNHNYSLKDVIYEFEGKAKLVISRNLEPTKKPGQSIITALDTLFPTRPHLKLNSKLIT